MGSGDNKIAAFKGGKSLSSSGSSSSGSGDAKIAAIKAAQKERSKAETPAEYAIRSGISSTDLMRAGMPASVVRRVAEAESKAGQGSASPNPTTTTESRPVTQQEISDLRNRYSSSQLSANEQALANQQQSRTFQNTAPTYIYNPIIRGYQKTFGTRVRETSQKIAEPAINRMNTAQETGTARAEGVVLSSISQRIYEGSQSASNKIRTQAGTLPKSSILGRLGLNTVANLAEGAGMVPGGVETIVRRPEVIAPALVTGAVSVPLGIATQARDNPAQLASDLVLTYAAAYTISGAVSPLPKRAFVPKRNPGIISSNNLQVVDDYVRLQSFKSDIIEPGMGPRNVVPTQRVITVDNLRATIQPDAKLPGVDRVRATPNPVKAYDMDLNVDGVRSTYRYDKMPSSLRNLMTDERGSVQLIPGSRTDPLLKPASRNIRANRPISRNDLIPSIESQIKQMGRNRPTINARQGQVNIPSIVSVMGLSPSIAQQSITRQLQGLTPAQLLTQAQSQAQTQAQTQKQIQAQAQAQTHMFKQLQAQATSTKSSTAPQTPKIARVPRIPAIPVVLPDVPTGSTSKRRKRNRGIDAEYERLINNWQDPTKINVRL